MNKIQTKVFTIFWLISGIVWGIISVRRIINKEDLSIIYIITTIIAFGLAFSFYRQWKK